MRAALPTLLLASTLLAVACQTDLSLPFSGSPTAPTPTPTSLPADRLPGGVRVQPGLGKVTLDWDPVAAASFVVYFTSDTSQALTRSNYSTLSGTRTASVVPPLTITALPADRASVFLVTAVMGTAESEGLAPIRTRALPSGWKGLVPSQTRISYAGTRNSGRLGFGLSAGDVDFDGFDDVLAGSPTSGTDAGHLFVFLGSSSGILASAAPQDIGFVGSAGAEFGFAVTAGHFDSDLYADVAVGAPADAAGGSARGTVVVLKGGPGGLSTTPFWTVSGPVNSDAFGSALASCELSRDTVDDLVVGSPSNGANQEGEAQLFTSASGALQTAVSRQWLGSSTFANFGAAVSCLGDVDDDGQFQDVGFGAPNQSVGSGAVSWAPGTSAAPGVALNAVQFYMPAVPGNAGAALAAAGDVDGDGKADMVFSSPTDAGGKAYWLRGTTAFPQPLGTPFATGATGARLGSALAGLDVNGDGFSDVLVGAAAAKNGAAIDTGAVELHLGGPAGLSTSAAFTAFGPSSGSLFGSALAGFRRGNLDSSADFAVGAYSHTQGATTQAGAIYVFYGPPTRGADVRPGAPNQSTAGSPVTLGSVTFTDPGWVPLFACDVDWGDMTATTHVDSCTQAMLQALSHVYATAGTWPVRIRVTNTAYGTSGEALASVVVP